MKEKSYNLLLELGYQEKEIENIIFLIIMNYLTMKKILLHGIQMKPIMFVQIY